MNNKRIAVLLATVMAVSMVAMGFVGTAAADSPEIDGGAEIFANPADEDESEADHTITYEITDGSDLIDDDVAGSDIEIDYTGEILLGGTFDSESDVAVEIVDDDGDVVVSDGDGGDGIFEGDNSGVSEDGDEVTITAGDDVDHEFAEGDILRVVMVEDIDQSGASETADTSVDVEVDSQDNIEEVTEIEVLLEDDAPVELDNGGDGADFFSSVIFAADGDQLDTTDAIEVSDDVDEFTNAPATLEDSADGEDLSTADLDEEVNLVGVNGAPHDVVLFNDNDDIEAAFELSTNDEYDVTGLNFESSDFLEHDQIDTAIDATDTSAPATDLTIDEVEFQDFDGPVVNIDEADDAVIGDGEAVEFSAPSDDVDGYVGVEIEDTDGSDDDDIVLYDVTFEDVGDSTAVDITTDDGGAVDVDIEAVDVQDLESSGVGITVDAQDGADVELDNIEISGDNAETGIELDDSDAGASFTIDSESEDHTVIENVDAGIDADEVQDNLAFDFSGEGDLEFDDIGDTAVSLEGDYDDGTIDIEDLFVNNSADATAIHFDDDGTNLDVDAANFGAEGTVEKAIVVDEADDDVNIGTNDDIDGIELSDNGDAVGIEVTATDLDSGGLNIEEVAHITGDGDGTGIHVDVGTQDDFDISDVDRIEDVETGIEVADSDDQPLTLDDGITIEDYTEAGVDFASDENNAELTIGGATFIEHEDGTASAVAIDVDSADADTTIDSETEIHVADNEDSIGIEFTDDNEPGDSADITVETVTIEPVDGEDSSEGTAIALDNLEGSEEVSIKFNDIVGFTDGYGLAGDDADDLDREEAIGNWWGHDFGPQHEDASNVFVDVDADADASSVYDPFLTTNIEDTDLDLDSPDNDQVLDFAHDIYVQEGEIGTVAFPSYSANELSEGEAFELIGGDEADIVRYDAVSDDWVGGAENDEIPEGLDAYAVIADDTDVLFKVEYEDDDNVIRGDYTYESGWNLVPTAASNDDIGSSGDKLTLSNTFDLDSQSDGEFTSAFDSPGLQINPSSDIKTATDGDQLEDLSENEVSAFHPMWVYVEGSSVGETNTAAFDPDADMQDVLDSIEQSD